jgi:serine/threonine protein kinase
MTPDLATRLILRLAEIVAHAHGANPPIVHGDLKPANVLVRRTPDGKVQLRVTDFGIGALAAAQAARETRQPTHSRQVLLTEAVKGAYTPLYASQQQMGRRPGEPADTRDDIHALGVIWYQVVTGNLAAMSVPTDWREDVQERGLSEALVQLLASCMSSKAEKRPANAAILAEKLRALTTPPQGEPKGMEGRRATTGGQMPQPSLSSSRGKRSTRTCAAWRGIFDPPRRKSGNLRRT